MRFALLVAVLGALLATAPAQAAFSGSNGQLAWISYEGHQLMVDDPWDEEPAKPLTPVSKGDSEHPTDPESAPSWSPDGTKLLFTDTIDYPYPYPDVSAVFVIDRDGKNRTQVSTPFEPVPDTCNGDCDNGEISWDYAPIWTPDGDIAFIRWVAAGDEAPHGAIQGTNIYRVDANGSGGGEQRIAREHPKTGMFQSIVWPTGASEPTAVFMNGAGLSIRKAVSKQTIRSDFGVNDLDVSPDGQKLVYVGLSISSGPQIITIDADDGSEIDRFGTGMLPGWVRFTPDNNGLIRPGCADDTDGQQHCGWITHRLPDPEGDVKPGEPEERPYLDMNPVIASPDQPGHRSMVDIQSQDLPVIYAPGFLGSQIQCAGESVWMPALPPLDLTPLSLSADGKGNAQCAGAGPTGEVVDEFLKADVYGHANDWLEAMNPPGGWATYGWDWRKAPQESLQDLDGLIDSMLLNELPHKQGASRVTLAGHSYGGLLIRTYIDDPAKAKKVARILTVGSPWWGSAKPIFSTTFGVESPGFGALDLFFENSKLKAFMQNLSGAYHLFPSDNYGGWLRVDGVEQGQAGVKNWVSSIGGNTGLLEEAWGHHRENIDGFFDNHGKIDVRSVVGLGLPTVRDVSLVPNKETGTITAGVKYSNGDGTVPGHSATQGPIGTDDPLGDDIHTQQRCGIAHMDQTKDKVVQGAYAQFLLFGRIPRKLPPPSCPPKGKEIEVFHDLAIPAPLGGTRAGTRRAGSGGPMTLGDAELFNVADVMRLPGKTLIVTDDAHPRDLTFQADGFKFAVTDLEGSDRGRRLVYGPVSGTVVVHPGTGDAPAVTVGGAAVQPVEDSADGSPGGDTPTPPASGGGGGGDDAPPAGPGNGGGGDTPAQPSPGGGTKAPAARVTLPSSAKLRGGRVRVVLRADRASTGTVVLRSGKKVIGRARVSLAAGRKATIAVKVTARRLKRATLVVRVDGGASTSRSIVVRKG